MPTLADPHRRRTVIVTEKTKLGRILRSPRATEVLVEAVPEIDGSPHLDLMKGLSLERVATFAHRDRAWLEALVARLRNVVEDQSGKPAPRARTYTEIDDGPASSAPCEVQPSTPMWGVEELSFAGPEIGNPFVDVELGARFRCGGRSVTAPGFYDGNGVHRIRFMPDTEGKWTFRTASNLRSLDGIEGSFNCDPPLPDSHGPVRVAGTFHFAHADRTVFRPFGTTCYAWTHQGEDLELDTLTTLAASPFNKVRMCLFPKSYLYNENEPRQHAFERLPDGRSTSPDSTRTSSGTSRNVSRTWVGSASKPT
jgi:Domain of unknown function (DUF5060)